MIHGVPEQNDTDKAINRIHAELTASTGRLLVTVKWSDLQILFSEWERGRNSASWLDDEADRLRGQS